MLFGHVFKNCSIGGDTEADGWPTYAVGYVETVFFDGSKAPARPHLTAHYRKTAERAGYGSNVGAYCMEHEIAHTFLAEALGQPYSPTIHDAAHGLPVDLAVVREEERYVKEFQRLVNTGEREDGKLSVLLEAGLDVDALAVKFGMLLTDIFGPAWRAERAA